MFGLLCLLYFFFFFFSSRRRHTRSKRDWSSDVCSSDLLTQFFSNDEATLAVTPEGVVKTLRAGESAVRAHFQGQVEVVMRSEERRVGKSVDLGGRRIIKKKRKRKTKRRDENIKNQHNSR